MATGTLASLELSPDPLRAPQNPDQKFGIRGVRFPLGNFRAATNKNSLKRQNIPDSSLGNY
jgi:hypothetical protein